jgi:ribonuclease HI/DNA polymerase-3 subunit epsilon
VLHCIRAESENNAILYPWPPVNVTRDLKKMSQLQARLVFLAHKPQNPSQPHKPFLSWIFMSAAKHGFILYVDGACRGNPGIGGWGALLIDPNQQPTELYGGEHHTTNNRMELCAAIQGILACPPEAQITIYTDSIYVKRGITEWIANWKAKNWKDVKNPDLWQKLDQSCAGRQIEWHWIKGHAGHAGNERADQLANCGADSMTKKKIVESDWLIDDPLGLDQDQLDTEQALGLSLAAESTTTPAATIPAVASMPEEVAITASVLEDSAALAALQIKITPATTALQGQRMLILDTETTGFYFQDSDRVIEVGALEMINRRLTGSSIHIYINPEKDVGESENIHGLSNAFLADKAKFAEIAPVLWAYLQGAEIVAHNASFDMNFLDAEFVRAGLGKLSAVCTQTDTLALAKRKHPGQKNSLDALVKRYEVPQRDRSFHGALLDAEILADVYLAMTGGQVSLDIEVSEQSQHAVQQLNAPTAVIQTPSIKPHAEELAAHQAWLQHYREKNAKAALFEAN